MNATVFTNQISDLTPVTMVMTTKTFLLSSCAVRLYLDCHVPLHHVPSPSGTTGQPDQGHTEET